VSILIIEGADGTGKTRYARMLCREQGAKYLHKNKPKATNWFDEYVAPLQLLEQPIICDRWHVGELIWPVLFGRESLFATPSEYDACCEWLHDLDARLEVLVRNPREIAETLEKRGEDDQIETVLKSQDMFVDAASNTRFMPVQILDSNRIYEARGWR